MVTLVLGLLVPVATSQQIPRLLATSHKLPLDQVPPALFDNIQKWRTLNPGFEFHYFDDAEQVAFMRAHCVAPRCVEAYNMLNSGAGKADLFRVAWMYYSGGWWFDADLKPGGLEASCDLDAALDQSLFLLREPKHGHVRFMLMGGRHHPMLLANLYRQIANIFEAKALPPNRQPRTLHVSSSVQRP